MKLKSPTMIAQYKKIYKAIYAAKVLLAGRTRSEKQRHNCVVQETTESNIKINANPHTYSGEFKKKKAKLEKK